MQIQPNTPEYERMKEEIILRYLATEEMREKLALSMVEPLNARIMYTANALHTGRRDGNPADWKQWAMELVPEDSLFRTYERLRAAAASHELDKESFRRVRTRIGDLKGLHDEIRKRAL